MASDELIVRSVPEARSHNQRSSVVLPVAPRPMAMIALALPVRSVARLDSLSRSGRPGRGTSSRASGMFASRSLNRGTASSVTAHSCFLMGVFRNVRNSKATGSVAKIGEGRGGGCGVPEISMWETAGDLAMASRSRTTRSHTLRTFFGFSGSPEASVSPSWEYCSVAATQSGRPRRSPFRVGRSGPTSICRVLIFRAVLFRSGRLDLHNRDVQLRASCSSGWCSKFEPTRTGAFRLITT